MLASLRRVLPSLLGLLLLALFVWFAGPYFAFAGYTPLASPRARLITIGLVVVAWGAAVVARRVRANRASARIAAAAVMPAPSEAARPSADIVQLRERFEEAMAVLKGRRRSGHTLYELPWYVIIGAPGSGKTTALVNSGLHFPLEQKTGRNALRGVGGTRNCDWWFTDEAVFLDTAGRFTTQDSDATADNAAWLEFLGLLRKYRRRQPVNGVVLTISAQDLLMHGHVDLEGYIDAARRRLAELNRELQIQLPVYLLVTKCDLVSGFTEYFDDLTPEGRAQVWGVTFPYEQTVSGEAPRQCPPELDALIERLDARLLARVEEDRDVRRRVKIFGFPQQMALLREPLLQFVQAVFTSTRFDRQQTHLRGVYFTSGTQEGTPIDRLLGAIGRRFSVAPGAVAPASRGKAYFIHDVLTRVILAEAGIAGVNRRLEMKKAALQLGSYAAVAAVAVLAVVLLALSYRQNRAYVEAVGLDVAGLNEVPPAAASPSLDAALPRLDALRAVVASANRHPDGAPWSMRWGLYQGSSLTGAAEDAYARELDGVFLPHMASQFAQRLEQYAAEPETLYEYLKGYLMLGYPEHMDKARLAFLADIEWDAAFGRDPDRRTRVAQHFASLLALEDTLRPVPLDERLVIQARNALEQASKAGLIYRYIRIEYGSDTANGLRLDELGGLNAARVLRRKSGVSLSEPVPSLYTKPTFERIADGGIDDLVTRFLDEYWVWGDARPAITATNTLSNDVLDRYESDYIQFWDGIVNDLAAAPLGTLTQAKEAVALLGGPTSPLRRLLQVVDEHTFLVPPPAPDEDRGRIGAGIDRLRNLGSTVLGTSTAVPGSRVTAHFEPIHRLLAGGSGGAPIDAVLQRLQQLHQQLQPIGTGVGERPPGDPQAIAAIGDITATLQREAAPLPPSLAGIVTQVAAGATQVVRRGVRETLETRYQQEVVAECTTLVAGKYPIAPNGPDLPLQDFGRVFGHNGVYDRFVTTELANLVDTSRRPWRWLADASGATVGGSVDMLRRFEEAARIREMFFELGSSAPQLEFVATPDALDAGALSFTLEVDGAAATYRHDVPRPERMAWPGTKPGIAAVTFQSRAGSRPNIVSEGPWALFKLMESAQVERLTDDRYRLTFEAGGHRAEVLLDAGTARNPFGSTALAQFRCR